MGHVIIVRNRLNSGRGDLLGRIVEICDLKRDWIEGHAICKVVWDIWCVETLNCETDDL